MSEDKPITTNLYKLKSSQIAMALWIHGNISAAAAEAEVSRKTVHEWMHNSHFVTLIEQKGAEFEKEWLATIRTDPSWQSKAWLLERRMGSKYQPPKQRVEQEIKQSPRDYTDEELKAIIAGGTGSTGMSGTEKGEE